MHSGRLLRVWITQWTYWNKLEKKKIERAYNLKMIYLKQVINDYNSELF